MNFRSSKSPDSLDGSTGTPSPNPPTPPTTPKQDGKPSNKRIKLSQNCRADSTVTSNANKIALPGSVVSSISNNLSSHQSPIDSTSAPLQLSETWDHFSSLRHGHSHLNSHLTHHPHHGHHPHHLTHGNYNPAGLTSVANHLYSSPPSSSSSSGACSSLTPLHTSSPSGLQGLSHSNTVHNGNNGTTSGALLSGGSIHSGSSSIDPSVSPTMGHSPNAGSSPLTSNNTSNLTSSHFASGLLSNMKLESNSPVTTSADSFLPSGYAAAAAAAAAAHHSTSNHHHHTGHGMSVVPSDFSSAATAAVVQNAGLYITHDPHVHPTHYPQYFQPGSFVENWGGFHPSYL